MKNQKSSPYIRKEIYNVGDVLDQVVPSAWKNFKMFDGDEMDLTSQRYVLFKTKGVCCITCNLEGKFFAKEKNKGTVEDKYHFNLYGIDDEGNEVMLTKDHILPKSRGGKDHISNYVPMCMICNKKKGNDTPDSIKHRAKTILNVAQYNNENLPDRLGKHYAQCPYEDQQILRCVVKYGLDDFKVPDFLQWIEPMLKRVYSYQKKVIGIEHSFCYITVRHGKTLCRTDDAWHVDGFSLRINHIPEQNYVWSNIYPTEYVTKAIDLSDFDPFTENLHKRIDKEIDESVVVKSVRNMNIYCMDPYIIHRRPNNIPEGTTRTFIRISFVPIEIRDVNNTLNPLIPVTYERDGVKEFRNQLI